MTSKHSQDDCANIWGKPDISKTLISVYDCLMALTSACCLLSVMFSVGIMLNFSTIPKARSNQYARRLGWRIVVGRSLMNIALLFFALGAILKFSLVMKPAAVVAFLAAMAIFGAVYTYADSTGRAMMTEFMTE